MPSSSSLDRRQAEYTTLHAAFAADDTMVSIVPSFDFDGPIELMSSRGLVGPFKAGIAADVPIWVAMLLNQRSLCQVQAPGFLHHETLASVVSEEKSNNQLSTRLPFYYQEIAQRFSAGDLSGKGGGADGDVSYLSSSSSSLSKISSLLLEDASQTRLDKLRQQIQNVCQMEEKFFALEVNGIASTELTQLKPLIVQALDDRDFLNQSSSADDNDNDNENDVGRESQQQQRKNASPPITPVPEDDDENTTSNNSRRTSRIRRFRR